MDAGPLYAYVDADDAHHGPSRHLLEHHPGPILVPILVVTEVTYLLATRLGASAEVRFLGDLASGALTALEVQPAEWLRMAELVAGYAHMSLGSVDASLIAAAERLGIATVATFDRRHFAAVRPRHVEAFDLVPT